MVGLEPRLGGSQGRGWAILPWLPKDFSGGGVTLPGILWRCFFELHPLNGGSWANFIKEGRGSESYFLPHCSGVPSLASGQASLFFTNLAITS